MKKILFILFFLPQLTNAQIITTFAGGNTTSYGGDGGLATAALLYVPAGVAVDASGNKYIADAGNNRIRKVSVGGIITTIAGNGIVGYNGNGGPASASEINNPSGVAVDATGNIYIADAGNNCIRKINTSGIITTMAGNGTAGYLGDGGAATAAELYNPLAVAVDVLGNIYIADAGNQCIRKVSTGGIITTIAGAGVGGFSGDGGPATNAVFNTPAGVAIDGTGNIYISDEYNARIRMIDVSGIINTIAGNGTFGFSGDGGPAAIAELYQPTGIALNAAGNIYIADQVNNRIREINSSGIITTISGTGAGGFSGDGGPATLAEVYTPAGLATDGAGNIYIADGNNDRVRKINSSGIINTIAGGGTSGYGDGGPATNAQFSHPHDIAFDAAGNVYIVDYYHNLIRKVNTSGIISTFAGNGIQGYSGDGGPATDAALNWPFGIAIDNAGNVFISDGLNHCIRKVNTSGIISTVAGDGSGVYSGDGGPATAAGFGYPYYITVDGYGNLFFAIANEKIVKVNASGIISTIAGNGTPGYSGDGGPATSAQLNGPNDVSVDGSGNIYIADLYNYRIRKVNTSGIITTIAGTGTSGFSGDGGPATAAEFKAPGAVSIDGAGNLFITDELNNRIRKIDTTGIITTIAGDGIIGYSGDGGPATNASLFNPFNAKPDNHGHLYIADVDNSVIRKVSGLPITISVKDILNEKAVVIIYPNPATTELNITATLKINSIAISDLLGLVLYNHEYNTHQIHIDITDLPKGVYFININGSEVRKFVKQ